MAKTSGSLVCLFLAAFLFTALVPVSTYARQEETEQESQPIEKEATEKVQAAEKEAEKTGSISDAEVPEVIVPAPKDQKEAIGIYVFLVWIWVSILVLIYFLRLKVKETDRIHQLKFFSKE
jgi:hypothetical protein